MVIYLQLQRKNMKKVLVTAQYSFCEESAPYNGAVEVVERKNHSGVRTVGMRLRVGKRDVSIPRNRVSEIIAALQQAEGEASRQYTKIIEEMNHER